MVLEEQPDSGKYPQANGEFVPTLNNMGFMINTLDEIILAWVAFAPHGPGPALEIGTAYGVATLEAIKSGATVIANDLDPRHLEALEAQVSEADKGRLHCIAGAFPDEVHLAPNSIGSVLIARVFHFYDGSMIIRSVRALYECLAPGGKVFVTAETPYLRNLQVFHGEYEARKRRGDLWPGWVDNIRELDPERAKYLPPAMHFLDPDILSRVFQEAGFEIEHTAMFARPYFPDFIRWDGRESVGLIAVKSG